MTEHSALESACAEYLELLRFMVIRTHDSRNAPATPGIADLIAIRQKRTMLTAGGAMLHPVVLAVELKAGKDKLSQDQADWLARWREAGGMVIVARSLEELQEAIPR
jgi:hypothetical protein